ncbi:Hypothetical_protein [Hexamita inflata]|uniref:Hypothetical_protein n=1 Tax=Hexamita inflata TaxID=28002 RepID=A0AA86NHI5_9EUKA|nr:Hypothetical protein HINF_LOCUS7078 [Hexamita inflata]CAI9955538.1 Hypothetical protein HINF_LOCUS43183 [Hexamita inflata]
MHFWIRHYNSTVRSSSTILMFVVVPHFGIKGHRRAILHCSLPVLLQQTIWRNGLAGKVKIHTIGALIILFTQQSRSNLYHFLEKYQNEYFRHEEVVIDIQTTERQQANHQMSSITQNCNRRILHLRQLSYQDNEYWIPCTQ